MNIYIYLLYIHVYLCTTGPKSSGRAEKQRRAKSHCAEPRFSPGEGRVCKREGEGESVCVREREGRSVSEREREREREWQRESETQREGTSVLERERERAPGRR